MYFKNIMTESRHQPSKPYIFQATLQNSHAVYNPYSYTCETVFITLQLQTKNYINSSLTL